MHARSTTTRIPPEVIDPTAAFLREHALPRYREAQGFVQFLDFVDRQTGQAIAFTLWQSEADRRAAESLAARIRAEAGAMARSDPPTIEQFEVFIREQSAEPYGPGPAFTRLLRAQAAAGSFDRTLDYIRQSVVPQLRTRQGFREFCALGDRQTGRVLTFTIYDSASDLKAADAAAIALAAQATHDIALGDMDIKYYEVAIRA